MIAHMGVNVERHLHAIANVTVVAPTEFNHLVAEDRVGNPADRPFEQVVAVELVNHRGERAPAGPRYERTGSVRRCWSDPVGWAGLDKVSPTPGAELQAIKDRMAELDGQLAATRLLTAPSVQRTLAKRAAPAMAAGCCRVGAGARRTGGGA